MADAAALFKKHFGGFLSTGNYDEKARGDSAVAMTVLQAAPIIYAASIQAEAITNMRDEICGRLDRLETLLKTDPDFKAPPA